MDGMHKAADTEILHFGCSAASNNAATVFSWKIPDVEVAHRHMPSSGIFTGSFQLASV